MGTNPFHIAVAIGGVQGLVLGAFLVARGGANRRANRVLGLLVTTVALDMVFVYLNLSGVAARTGLFLFITDPLYPLFGPLLLLFVLYLTEEGYRPRRRMWFLSLPALAELALLVPTLLVDRDERLRYALEIAGGGALGELYYLVWVAELAFNLAMAIIAVGVVRRYTARIKTAASDIDHLTLPLLRAVLVASIVFLAAQIVAAVMVFFGTASVTATFVALYLLMGVCFYLLGYWALTQPEVFHPERFVVPAEHRRKYEKSSLGTSDLDSFGQTIEEAMETHRLYLQNDLRIADLAETTGLSTNHVSQVINAKFGKNFYDFVNSYRIAEAQRQLTDPSQQHIKLLAIALSAGFNSKSTFNKVFKEHTGLTPSEFQRNGPTV